MVEAFLKDYIEAFLARDGACIADQNLEVTLLGARSALATRDWEMRREDGSAIRRWRQTYNFVVADRRLRILASTIHLA